MGTNVLDVVEGTVYFFLSIIFVNMFFWKILNNIRTNLFPTSDFGIILLIIQWIGTIMIPIIVPIIFIRNGGIVDKTIKKVTG